MTTHGKISSSFAPFIYAEILSKQLEQLKQSSLNDDSEAMTTSKNLVENIVHLATLANSIDIKVRNDFLSSLYQITSEVKSIRSASLNTDDNLDILIAQAYIHVLELEEGVFNQRYNSNSERRLTLPGRQIHDIQQLKLDKKIQQMLSIAEGKIVELNHVVHFFEADASLPKDPTKIKSSPKTAQIATRNMYSGGYDEFYKEPYKSKASLPTVLYYLQQKLCGTASPPLDKILIKGQFITGLFLKENPPPEDDENFQIEFSALTKMEEFSQLMQQKPMEIDLTEGEKGFHKQLIACKKIINEQENDGMGFIISARGEHFGLYIDKKSAVTFFNPQGNYFSHHFPYTRELKSIEEAQKILAKRLPYIKTYLEVENYHTAIITPIKIQFDLEREIPSNPEFAHHSLLTFCHELLEAEQADENSYDLLMKLKNKQCMFALTEIEKTSVGDRLFLHFRQLHRKESSQKVIQDDQLYGRDAFQNIKMSTPKERRRCIQRIIVEIALSGLEQTIKKNDIKGVRQFLDLLEKVELDPKDQLGGQKDLALFLYRTLYLNYYAAWRANPSELISPNSTLFNLNFGKIAFRDDIEHKIAPEFKLEVLSETIKALQKHWF